VFASPIGLALLVSEQSRREWGLDDRDPNVTRGRFGGNRRRRPITRGELALGLLGTDATLALLALCWHESCWTYSADRGPMGR
jgi:hypothetical protein